MLRVVAILAYLLVLLPANAQMLLRGAGPGSAGGCSGASCITFTVTGPTTGTAGVASTNFTLTLGTGSFNGAQTITISDGTQGGTITPSVGSPGTSTVVVTPANLATSFTFTYTPVVGGPVSLSFTNAQGWTNTGAKTYTGAVTYTASGPATGTTGSASTNFTVSMPASVHFNGSQTVTVADAGNGGTFTPSVGSPGTSTVTVTPAAAATGFTFTYNAATDGAKTLSFTNAQAWTDPSPLTYTSSGAGAGCAEATAFLARTSGLTSPQQTAYTTLICGMVSDGSFAILDGLWIFATNTEATGMLNVISTSFNLTKSGTCGFTALSGTFNITACYFNPAYNPTTAGGHYALHSASVGSCVVSSTSVGNSILLGAANFASSYIYFGPRNNLASGTMYYTVSDNHYNSFAPTTNSLGSWIASRTANNLITLYRNGTSVATASALEAANVPNGALYIAAENNGTGTADQNNTDHVAYFFIGGGLTGPQVSALNTRLSTFLAAMGAPAAC